MNIGAKLKSYRKNAGLTQEEVAQKIYVSRATISSWETNRTFPDIEKIIYLSEIYQVSLDELLKEEPRIMENLKLERKKLKRYKILKVIGIILLSLFVIYNIFWFLIVYPKNQRLKSNWQNTTSNAYVKQSDGITFKAYSAHYLEPLNNNNIYVFTDKGSLFDIGVDKENTYVGINESGQLYKEKNKIFFAKIKKDNINKLDIIQGDETEIKSLLKENRKEFKKEYDKTLKAWESINK